MQFRLWLEEVEKDHKYWTHFFLGVFNLQDDADGLSKPLAGFDVERLKNTGEFQALDPQKQQEILNKIQQGSGTVGDLVTVASGRNAMDHPAPRFSISMTGQ